MRAVFVVVLLAAIAAGAWLLRDRIPGFGDPPEITEVSPAAAEQAEAKLRALREDGEAVRLSEVELNSLVRYRLGPQIPGDIYDPSVRLSGDTIQVGGRIPADLLPAMPELDRVRAFLPDTAEIQIAGRLDGGAGEAYFDVREVEFAGIPVPPRFYPQALRRLGRADRPGLPETAYPFRLPDGVGDARVEGGVLILEPAAER